MKSIKILALLFFFQLNAVLAKLEGTSLIGHSGYAEVNTCRVGITKYVFNYKALGLSKYSKFWDAICGYPPATGTVLLCTDALTGNNTLTEENVYKYLEKNCLSFSSYNHSWTYYRDQKINATNYYVPLTKLNISHPIYSPTVPNLKTIESTYKTYKASTFALDSGTYFSAGICGYFLLLIIIGSIYNFSRKTSISKSFNGSKASKLFQKYLIFPTLIPNGKFSEPYGFKYFSVLFPNRIQFVTDAFLFGLQIAFYCVNYNYVTKSGWVAYVADRTGIMAFGKIPLLILFAGRNNFLIYITGWSHSTFLHFHKVVAYWMFLDSLIHSVAYTIDYLGKYVKTLKETYFACGVAATVLCGVLVLHSMHAFRKNCYEYFLVLHVILAIGFIVMCWYHCNVLGWMEWLVAACCVWFFDRLVRVIRMFAFGYKNATIFIVGDQLMKVEVSKPVWWFHSPGTYSYIYFANFIFWENHPFTVVLEDNKICAYIKVKKGVTKRIWNKLNAEKGKISCKVCIEGPYGGGVLPKLKKYDYSLLIAGGSGVPGILESATKISNGKFIWISQSLETIKCYKNLILDVDIPIDFYITRENGSDKLCTKQDLFEEPDLEICSTDSPEKSTMDKSSEIIPNQVSIHYVKPDMLQIIDSSVTEANSTNIGIVACGPPKLNDNIRHVISKKITSWDKSIDFFDEFQTW